MKRIRRLTDKELKKEIRRNDMLGLFYCVLFIVFLLMYILTFWFTSLFGIVAIIFLIFVVGFEVLERHNKIILEIRNYNDNINLGRHRKRKNPKCC